MVVDLLVMVVQKDVFEVVIAAVEVVISVDKLVYSKVVVETVEVVPNELVNSDVVIEAVEVVTPPVDKLVNRSVEVLFIEVVLLVAVVVEKPVGMFREAEAEMSAR